MLGLPTAALNSFIVGVLIFLISKLEIKQIPKAFPLSIFVSLNIIYYSLKFTKNIITDFETGHHFTIQALWLQHLNNLTVSDTHPRKKITL